MNSILNIGLSGLQTFLNKIRNTAHNVANVNTPAYKSTRIDTQASPSQSVIPGKPEIQQGSGVQSAASSRLVTQGGLIQTSNSLDLAIQGDGFFQFQQPDGTISYSRNGSLQKSANGQLVNADGLVLNPSISIPPEATAVTITADGIVKIENPQQQQPQTIGQISLTQFPNPGGLKAIGGNQYAETGASGNPIQGNPGQGGFGQILQGYLETSNVDLVDTQVNLIMDLHAFKSNAKSIQTGDETLGTIIDLKK